MTKHLPGQPAEFVYYSCRLSIALFTRIFKIFHLQNIKIFIFTKIMQESKHVHMLHSRNESSRLRFLKNDLHAIPRVGNRAAHSLQCVVLCVPAPFWLMSLAGFVKVRFCERQKLHRVRGTIKNYGTPRTSCVLPRFGIAGRIVAILVRLLWYI